MVAFLDTLSVLMQILMALSLVMMWLLSESRGAATVALAVVGLLYVYLMHGM